MSTSKSMGFWSRLLNREEIFDKPAQYTPVAGKSSGPYVREEPATINLVRAVFDEASNIIKKIDRDLVAMDVRKEQLIRDRTAHIELLEVATKYVEQSGKK
jgi:hypothetical protein